MEWKLGEESLYAVKTIRDKEEIIVNYSETHVWFAPKNLRQAQTNQDFGFICHRQICDGSVDSVGCSDRRCIKPHRLETAVGDGILIWRIQVELFNIVDSDAFQICGTHGDLAHAVAFAELATKKRDGDAHF